MLKLRAHLIAAVFREPPPTRWRLSCWEAGLLCVSILAIAVVLQLARMGWSISLRILWAEDGAIFVREAYTLGFWDALVNPYGGYLLVGPHLIGELTALLPLADAPAAIAILSATVVGASGIAVWLGAAGQIQDPILRGTLAALTVLAPYAGVESVVSAAYTLWFLLFAAFWTLLWRPRGWGGTAFAAALLLFTGLSSPGVLFFAPLAFLRLVAVRDGRDATIVAAWVAGAVAQIPVLLFNSQPVTEPAWSHHIWTDYLQRVLLEAALGLRLAGNLWAELGWPVLIAALAAAVAGVTFGLARSDTRARWIVSLAVPISIAMFFASLYQRDLGAEALWPADTFHSLDSRYAIVPALLLVSAALVMIEGARRRRPAERAPVLAGFAATAVLIVALLSSFWAQDPPIRGGTPWGNAIDAAAMECEAGGVEEALVPIAPPGWMVPMPCETLVAEAS